GFEEEEGAEDANRQRDNDTERDEEALVLSNQDEIHKDNNHQENIECDISSLRLVIGEAAPGDVESWCQRLGGNGLHGGDCLAAAVTLGRRSLNGGGWVEVVSTDLVETLLFLELHES